MISGANLRKNIDNLSFLTKKILFDTDQLPIWRFMMCEDVKACRFSVKREISPSE